MLLLRQKVFETSLIFLIAALASTTAFWFLSAPSSLILAVLQFIVIVTFTVVLLGLSAKLSVHFSTLHGVACMVFVATSMLLLITGVLRLHPIIRAGLSLFVVSLLPGYSILRLTRINPPKSYVETVV